MALPAYLFELYMWATGFGDPETEEKLRRELTIWVRTVMARLEDGKVYAVRVRSERWMREAEGK